MYAFLSRSGSRVRSATICATVTAGLLASFHVTSASRAAKPAAAPTPPAAAVEEAVITPYERAMPTGLTAEMRVRFPKGTPVVLGAPTQAPFPTAPADDEVRSWVSVDIDQVSADQDKYALAVADAHAKKQRLTQFRARASVDAPDPATVAAGPIQRGKATRLAPWVGSPDLDPELLDRLTKRSLMITTTSVVNDPVRTTGAGEWTFGHLMRQLANEPQAGISPPTLAREWLRNWEAQQTVNGRSVPARAAGIRQQIIEPWEAASGRAGKPLDLDKAPFRLLAIVSRLDPRKNLVLGAERIGDGGAGEARFVSCALSPTDKDDKGNPMPILFTAIFESGVQMKMQNVEKVREGYPQTLTGGPAGNVDVTVRNSANTGRRRSQRAARGTGTDVWARLPSVVARWTGQVGELSIQLYARESPSRVTGVTARPKVQVSLKDSQERSRLMMSVHPDEIIHDPREYLLASDFDQTLSFNDSGFVLSQLIGASGFEDKTAGLARTHLVQQGGELAYLLRHDPEYRGVRREHLVETGKRVRLKSNIDLLAQLLEDGIDGHRFAFHVISAAPQEVVQSALEGIVPPDHIFGTRLDWDPGTGEVRSVGRVAAGYGKVAVLDELQERLQISPDRIVYVGDGSSDVHVMLHVNRRDGFTIAVSENKYIVPIARRSILSDDALSVLVPVLEDIVGWTNPARVRALFESRGLQIQAWDKVRSDFLTIRPSPAAVSREAGRLLEVAHV